MVKVRGYDFLFEDKEVETSDKIKNLIDKGRIKLPGDLINAIMGHLASKGVIKTAKECERQEKMLIAGINQMRKDLIVENKLDVEKIDWKEFEKKLMYIALEEFFAEE